MKKLFDCDIKDQSNFFLGKIKLNSNTFFLILFILNETFLLIDPFYFQILIIKYENITNKS